MAIHGIVRVRAYSRKGTYVKASTRYAFPNTQETFIGRYSHGGRAGRSRAIVFSPRMGGRTAAVSMTNFGPFTNGVRTSSRTYDNVTRSSARRLEALAARIR